MAVSEDQLTTGATSMPQPSHGGSLDDRSYTVPAWCTWTLEVAMLLLVSVTILGGRLLLPAALVWTTCLLLALALLAWTLQWAFLRRFQFLEIWPLWLVALPAALAALFQLTVPASSARQLIWVALLVMVVLGSGYTESQINRLLGWIGCVTLLLAIFALWFHAVPGRTGPLQGQLSAQGPEGLIGSSWQAGTFAIAATVALAVYGFRMLAVAAPATDRGPARHSRSRLVSSRGLNLALIAAAATAVVFLWLWSFDSLLALPVAAAALFVYLVLMAVKRLVAWPLALLLCIALPILAVLSLGRPSGERFTVDKTALTVHAAYLASGHDFRLDKESMRVLNADPAVAAPEPPEESLLLLAPAHPVFTAVNWLRILLAAALAILWGAAFWGYARGAGGSVALAAGSFVLLPVLAASTIYSDQPITPALAVVAAVFVAIAAVGGDFEEEMEVD